MLSTTAFTPATTAGRNAVSRDLTRPLIYSQSFDFTSIRRPNGVFLCSPSYRRFSPAMAAVTGHQVNGIAVGVKEAEEEEEEEEEKSLADRLRLGSLTEDGLSYKERFIVRCYEVGVNKTATVETIANLLQEVGGNHAQSVGFSTDGFATTTTMRKLHLIWVTARMHIKIYRYPAWSDVVEIETWCQSEGRIGTRRDWILKDYANGEVIGRATSKWVMMNEDTRKLQKVSDDVRDEYLIFCPKTLRLAFPEENNNSLKKIAKLEDPAEYSRLGLVPRRADLDMNKHVNNVTYIGWVLERTMMLNTVFVIIVRRQMKIRDEDAFMNEERSFGNILMVFRTVRGRKWCCTRFVIVFLWYSTIRRQLLHHRSSAQVLHRCWYVRVHRCCLGVHQSAQLRRSAP